VEQWPQAKRAATYQAKCYTPPLSAPTELELLLKARLHGWISHGTSHWISQGTQLVPKKVRETLRVNGEISVRPSVYHGISRGMSHGMSHCENGHLESILTHFLTGYKATIFLLCKIRLSIKNVACNVDIHQSLPSQLLDFALTAAKGDSGQQQNDALIVACTFRHSPITA
jgi:hypothetical protein